MEPDIVIPSRDRIPDPAWAVTRSAGSPVNTTVQTILWYNTGGLHYSDSISIGFDACALQLGDDESILSNTYRRSQYDNGSCLATLDASCIEAVQRQSEEFAMQLVYSRTYLSDGNLTAGSIVGVCDEIVRRMATTLPHQCRPYFSETRYAPIGAALTGIPLDPCTLKDESNETFHSIFGYQYAEDYATSHAQYDKLRDDVKPVLTVFMPVANSERQVLVNEASSTMTCVQVTDYNPGSRIPASQGEPTPVHISTGGASLSNSEIAGVVVAVTLGFGLLVVALVVWWLRRRKASRAVAQTSPSDSPVYEKDSQVAVATEELGNDGARHELEQHGPELPDAGSKNPVELEASNADSRHTGRLPL
jgi:hypothetical protein